METEIQDVIEKNLPSAVGDVLKTRLIQADKDTKELAITKANFTTLQIQVQQQETQLTNLTDRERILNIREFAVTEREKQTALNELRVEMYKERIADLKQITLAVFANNKYKYAESGYVPAFIPPTSANQYGNIVQANTSKSVEGEN